jgi:hypothetical protein
MRQLLAPIRLTPAPRNVLTVVALLCTALLTSGCVTVYQPLRALQRPVVLSIDENNFEGLKVQVRCPPGAFVKGGEANKLCRKVERVLSNQGAVVGGGVEQNGTKPDLIIDIESRLLSDDTDRLFSVLCILSGTLIPWVTDTSLAEDITIRDADGFVLASDSFQARFVTYIGLAVWAVNGLLDLLVRGEDEKLVGKAQNAVVSKDFYSQLSQLAFHARTRSLVLRNFERGK